MRGSEDRSQGHPELRGEEEQEEPEEGLGRKSLYSEGGDEAEAKVSSRSSVSGLVKSGQ